MPPGLPGLRSILLCWASRSASPPRHATGPRAAPTATPQSDERVGAACWRRAGASPGTDPALKGRTRRFPGCKCSHSGRFHAANVRPPNPELETDAPRRPHEPEGAGRGPCPQATALPFRLASRRPAPASKVGRRATEGGGGTGLCAPLTRDPGQAYFSLRLRPPSVKIAVGSTCLQNCARTGEEGARLRGHGAGGLSLPWRPVSRLAVGTPSVLWPSGHTWHCR